MDQKRKDKRRFEKMFPEYGDVEFKLWLYKQDTDFGDYNCVASKMGVSVHEHDNTASTVVCFDKDRFYEYIRKVEAHAELYERGS